MALPTRSGLVVPKRMTFRQIADDLEERIANGEYGPPGSRLPSYLELAQLYTVGKSTAANVYSLLVDRGVVYGEQGRAMFISDSIQR